MTGLDPAQSPIPVGPVKPIAFHSFHLAGVRVAMWWKNRSDIRDRRAAIAELGA